MVSEKLLTLSVVSNALYLDLTEALGRYVIEQISKSNISSTNMEDEKGFQGQVQHQIMSTDTDENSLSSISGHRVPVTGPRQLQKQQFDSTNVRAETVLVMSILGAAFVLLI